MDTTIKKRKLNIDRSKSRSVVVMIIWTEQTESANAMKSAEMTTSEEKRGRKFWGIVVAVHNVLCKPFKFLVSQKNSKTH
jgi:hypothetical protein